MTGGGGAILKKPFLQAAACKKGFSDGFVYHHGMALFTD